MAYRNLNRPGIRTSTTVDPRIVEEDISYQVRRLNPEATPLQTLKDWIGTGKKPEGHKVQVTQFNSFDNYDTVSSMVCGTGSWARFASITLDQLSRPDVSNMMYYYPQDKLYIANTGQTVEVIANPEQSIRMGNTASSVFSVQDAAMLTLLRMNTATTTQQGTVLVRNIVPAPILPLKTTPATAIYLGRTISESQDIEATPAQRDYVFDCNFVEHKEKVIIMTEDQKNLVKLKGVAPDWTMQQKEMLQEMRNDVEYNAMFSERMIDMKIPGEPTRHMRGLVNTIRTNVAAWNPDSTDDFESLYSNFLFEQAFRYNPNGMHKIGVCGGRFLYRFNQAFKEYRINTGLKLTGEAGMNISTYEIPGGMKLSLTRSEALRQNTIMENWCFVIDPANAEWRIVKDYNTRMYNLDNERKFKLMVEWQGTIAWNLEQSHALLKTYN